MTDFNQTVDLKEQMEQKKKARQQPAKQPVSKAAPEKKAKPKKDALDEMYEEDNNNIKNIDRPASKEAKTGGSKTLYNVIIIVLLVALGYFAFFRTASAPESDQSYTPKWYKIYLNNGEFYYGYIERPAADPVVIENVYYDYDQLNAPEGQAAVNETGDIRLVRRGQETHGPDGTLTVYQEQISKLEGLNENGNVLQAIRKDIGQ